MPPFTPIRRPHALAVDPLQHHSVTVITSSTASIGFRIPFYPTEAWSACLPDAPQPDRLRWRVVEVYVQIKSDHLMQFKVSLRGLRPPIWRRIQVPCTYSFWELHVAIQDAFGWEDRHLHEFRIPVPLVHEEVRIGIPLEEDLDTTEPVLPGWLIPIAEVFTLANRKAQYTYDFGDDWLHSVFLEKIAPVAKDAELPACTGGRRACPPEDCGGPPGYESFLEASPTRSTRCTRSIWRGLVAASIRRPSTGAPSSSTTRTNAGRSRSVPSSCHAAPVSPAAW